MHRDPDLIRNILLKVDQANGRVTDLELETLGYTREQIVFHVQLLIDAEFVQAGLFWSDNRCEFIEISRLTWKGAEFLDAARNELGWAKAKEMSAQMGGFVFEIAKSFLIDYLKTQFIPH